MIRLLIVIIAVAATAAYAQDRIIPLIVMSNSSIDARQVFQMGAGACLRGPLWFKDDAGRIIFQLSDGVEYPVGCSQK